MRSINASRSAGGTSGSARRARRRRRETHPALFDRPVHQRDGSQITPTEPKEAVDRVLVVRGSTDYDKIAKVNQSTGGEIGELVQVVQAERVPRVQPRLCSSPKVRN